MSLACILFLKNENKFVYGPNDMKPSVTMLEQQLMFLESFVDSVYILDDKSTDESVEVYKKYHKRGLVKYWETTGNEFNEQQYCARLLEFVKFNNHEWMLYLDGDEVLEDDARKWISKYFINEEYGENFRITVRFNYINLWRSRKQYRVDQWYNMESGKLFHVTPDLISFGTAFNDHFYAYQSPPDKSSESVFDFGNVVHTDLKIIHYAWVDWEHQLKKVQRNIKFEMENKLISYEEAEKIYGVILDEEGIVLKDVESKWQEEFRTGRIFYNK